MTLLTSFTVQLPQVFARMGYAGDFMMAGQWYPKIAVYEPKGTRGQAEEGWNLHQYHGNSEFYADFGIYNVKLRVPVGYTVAASGFPTKPVVNDGKTRLYTFYADDVHDFAWAASPNFVYFEEPYATKDLPGVRIKLYLDPKHEHLKARYMTAAKKALARYSEWYGSYPYSTLSIVVPPENGNGAGGMEYPTLVTAWGAGEDNPSLELERVIVHEIGHQFFYGMVAATNSRKPGWTKGSRPTPKIADGERVRRAFEPSRRIELHHRPCFTQAERLELCGARQLRRECLYPGQARAEGDRRASGPGDDE